MSMTETGDLFGYEVLDSGGHKVGSVDNIWVAHDGTQAEFIGIKSGWLSSRTYVIPAVEAQIDTQDRTIRLPYQEERIKNAPALSSSDDLTDDDITSVETYYGTTYGTAPHAATGTGPSAADTTAADRTGTFVGERATADDVRVPIVEEELAVGKRAVEAGRVRLRKIVRTEHVEQPVTLRHEEVSIERVPATDATVPDEAFREQVIEVPVMREEVVTSKEAHVTGEVRVHRTAESETRTVEGDVRKEDVEVDRGDVAETSADVRSDAYQTTRRS